MTINNKTRNYGLIFLTIAISYATPATYASGLPSSKDAEADSVFTSFHIPAFPVLLGKENNPVLKLELEINATSDPKILQQVRFKLKGSNPQSDVRELRIFETPDYKLIGSGKAPVIGSVEVQPECRFTLNHRLEKGAKTFWIAVRLSDQADIKNNLFISDLSVTISGKEYAVRRTSDSQPFLRLGVALRQKGQDKVHSYRIPGLATTRKGTLIAVYDNRYNNSKDLQEDIDVGMQRSKDGGQTWEPMRVIMNMGKYGGKAEDENGIGDPSILIDDQTGTIWVAALWLHGNKGEHAFFNGSKPGLSPNETAQLMMVKSEDDGLTWSEPINVTAMVKNPAWYLLLQGPGKGITLKDGTLAFPAQFKDENKKVYSTLIYSNDKGKSWIIGTGAESETTEAQLVQLADGDIMLNMRNEAGRTGNGRRTVATTSDLGKTWKKHPSSHGALPEPVCMASLIKHRYKGKDYLVFSNPNESNRKRHNFTIKLSKDEGMTWPDSFQILLDEGTGNGYSCMTSVGEGYIGVVYEGSQADLVYQVVPFRELLEGAPAE